MKNQRKSKKSGGENWIINRPVTIDKKESVLNTFKTMASQNADAILVTDGKKLLGIFTSLDILKVFKTADLTELESPIEKFMTPNPLCAQVSDTYHAVYSKMLKHNIRHIPILRDSELVGVASLPNLIGFYHNKIEAVFVEAKQEFQKLENLLEVSGNERIEYLSRQIKKYKKLCLRDHLTGLYNRRYIETRVQEELDRAKRYNSCFSIVFCDIDNFKQANDRYGHDCGDKIIRDVGELLVGQLKALNSISQLRKSDVVARYGGEEFILFLPQTNVNGAHTVASRLREIIEKYQFSYQENIINITVSFGIAEFDGIVHTSAELIKKADFAMYLAKQKGANRVEIYYD